MIPWPMVRMAMPTKQKYLLYPTLSTNQPMGKPNKPTTMYVMVIFLPAVNWEKQNLTWSN
jgi:hypothetical protein